jgi:hypothetical protein
VQRYDPTGPVCFDYTARRSAFGTRPVCAQHAHTARKEATVYSGLQTVGMSTGRQKMDPLNEAQRPNVRGVRVVLSTGYNP